MRRALLGAACLAICLGVGLGRPAAAWAPWELWQGHRAYARGDFEAATRRFERAVGEAPRDPLGHLALGLSLYRQGRYPRAAGELVLASQSSDASLRAQAFFALGNLRFRQQDYRAAAEAYRACLRWNEDDDAARHNLWEAMGRLPRSAPPQSSPSPSPGPPQAPPAQPPPSLGGPAAQEAERLLRYFDERERRHRQPVPGRPRLKPPRGTETW